MGVQFASSSYTTLGDPYAKKGNVLPRCHDPATTNPHTRTCDHSLHQSRDGLSQTLLRLLCARYKKKQFLTEPSKKGRTKDTLFGRAFPFLADVSKRCLTLTLRSLCYCSWRCSNSRRRLGSEKRGCLAGREVQ